MNLLEKVLLSYPILPFIPVFGFTFGHTSNNLILIVLKLHKNQLNLLFYYKESIILKVNFNATIYEELQVCTQTLFFFFSRKFILFLLFLLFWFCIFFVYSPSIFFYLNLLFVCFALFVFILFCFICFYFV